MRLSYSESDTEHHQPQLDPAVSRAAADHIVQQEQAAGWVDPDQTRVVPVPDRPRPDVATDPTPKSSGADGSTDPDDSTDQDDEKKTILGLSPAQIAGGALASSTAAVLGSNLGVAGTVAGAALTSLTITVGGAFYTKSISTTGSKLSAVASRFRLGGTTPLKNVPDVTEGASMPLPTPADVPDATEAAGPRSRASWRDKISPVRLVAATAAIFMLAAGVVTGLEALRGESFSGNGSTTVGQISREGISSSSSRGSTADTTDNDSQQSDSDAAGDAAATPAPSTTAPEPANTPAPRDPAPTTDPSSGTDSTGSGSTSTDGSDTADSDTSTGSGSSDSSESNSGATDADSQGGSTEE